MSIEEPVRRQAEGRSTPAEIPVAIICPHPECAGDIAVAIAVPVSPIGQVVDRHCQVVFSGSQ